MQINPFHSNIISFPFPSSLTLVSIPWWISCILTVFHGFGSFHRSKEDHLRGTPAGMWPTTIGLRGRWSPCSAGWCRLAEGPKIAYTTQKTLGGATKTHKNIVLTWVGVGENCATRPHPMDHQVSNSKKNLLCEPEMKLRPLKSCWSFGNVELYPMVQRCEIRNFSIANTHTHMHTHTTVISTNIVIN